MIDQEERMTFNVGEVANMIGVSPQSLTSAFYNRQLDVSRCPVVGGRRMIPAEYVPEIVALMKTRRKRRKNKAKPAIE